MQAEEVERLRAELEAVRTQKDTLHAEKLEVLEELEVLKAEKDARLTAEEQQAEAEGLVDAHSEAR